MSLSGAKEQRKRQRIMTAGDVARAFAVSHRTVRRWADVGMIPSFKTLGGHRRFYQDDVRTALERQGWNGKEELRAV